MTKSFLEIAQEITDLCEQRFEPEDEGFWSGHHCGGCTHDEDDECEGVDPRVLSLRLNRDVDLAIEAILRREFGDNNGPALERKVGRTTTSEPEISK